MKSKTLNCSEDLLQTLSSEYLISLEEGLEKQLVHFIHEHGTKMRSSNLFSLFIFLIIQLNNNSVFFYRIIWVI